MEIFEQSFRVGAEGLSTRELFFRLQEAANAQCAAYRLTGDDLREKGLMWVVLRYLVRVPRWPEPGETLRLQTWPGATRHGMMPRFYRMLDAAGSCVASGSGVWTVVDRETRRMVNPDENGVILEPLTTGLEERRPPAPARLALREYADYTVTEEVLDANGHMNNTRYYELAERCIRRAGAHPRRIVTEHQNEIRLGQSMRVSWGWEGERCFIEGANDAPVFRMELDYGD